MTEDWGKIMDSRVSEVQGLISTVADQSRRIRELEETIKALKVKLLEETIKALKVKLPGAIDYTFMWADMQAKIRKLEHENERLCAEVRKQVHGSKVVFDREIVELSQKKEPQ